jgi:ATP-binding cassette subfamily B multidrug efflux pump
VDRILVLKDGRIAEEGPFKALLKRHGAFYQYYNTQFRET